MYKLKTIKLWTVMTLVSALHCAEGIMQYSEATVSFQLRGCHRVSQCGLCQCCTNAQKTLAACRGPNITDVVDIGIPTNVTELTFENTGISVLNGQPHPDPNFSVNITKFCQYPFLRTLTFKDNLMLEYIGRGAFDFSCPYEHIYDVQGLSIWRSPKLSQMDDSLGNFGNLQNLQISNCGLKEVPQWGIFTPSTNAALTQLDLSKNSIKVIPPFAFEHINGAVGTLILDENDLEVIEEEAFSLSRIKELRMRHNKNLRTIAANAFKQATLLEILDLSETRIESLPTAGLQNLHTLRLKSVPSLTVFPLVVEMSSMKTAELTYPYHCCAFTHPDKQDESRYAQFEKYLKRECSTPVTSTSTTPSYGKHVGSFFSDILSDNNQAPTVPRSEKQLLLKIRNRDTNGIPQKISQLHDILKQALNDINEDDYSEYGFQDNWGSVAGRQFSDDDGTWIQSTIDPRVDHTKIVQCGLVVHDPRNVTCTPSPDAFNPCEDIMGYMWLRVIVWFVVSTALVGNSVVLVVTAFSKYKLTVAKFLMCNLSFADFCLGFYLLLLAGFDAHSSGHYFSVAFPWQYGGGCQAAGFLATFSVCLGVYTLAVITMERWYAISYAIDFSKRIRMKQAYTIMTIGYLYSFFMAVLPLLGVSGYSKTSICLPMETSRMIDLIYIILLLLFNATVFSIIFVCYIDMYRHVRGNNSAAGRNDANIAKRMSILVFTDFACFFPMAFFGLTAAAGRPLITITESKILLVFFFPLNSCANPFLYALFTNQFKKDWQGLLTRCGLSQAVATQPRGGVNWNQHISLSHSRNSNPQRTSGTLLTSLLSSSSSDSRMSRNSQPLKRDMQYTLLNRDYIQHQTGKESTEKIRENRRLSIVIEASHVVDEDHFSTMAQTSDPRASTVESVSTEPDIVDMQDSDISPDAPDTEHPLCPGHNHKQQHDAADTERPYIGNNYKPSLTDIDFSRREQPDGQENNDENISLHEMLASDKQFDMMSVDNTVLDSNTHSNSADKDNDDHNSDDLYGNLHFSHDNISYNY